MHEEYDFLDVTSLQKRHLHERYAMLRTDTLSRPVAAPLQAPKERQTAR